MIGLTFTAAQPRAWYARCAAITVGTDSSTWAATSRSVMPRSRSFTARRRRSLSTASGRYRASVLSLHVWHTPDEKVQTSYCRINSANLRGFSEASLVGPCGKFGNPQPIHKPGWQGTRAQDWPSPISASVTRSTWPLGCPRGSVADEPMLRCTPLERACHSLRCAPYLGSLAALCE